MTEKRKDDENNSEDEEEQFSKSKYVPPHEVGRPVTLQMLLDANILTPGKGNMSIEYMGQKFIGDLLEDAKIKSHETETIFCSPSAWAINCKKIINPEKKSGCGWASVRYNGKKLDIYKAQYHKKVQKKRDELEENDTECDVKENVPRPFEQAAPVKQIHKHQMLCNRTVLQDIHSLVETTTFASMGRIQPFIVNVSISSLLIMDFHCHLTSNEVTGYFGGTWDYNTHNLSITHCYPLLNSSKDRKNIDECEAKIQKDMLSKNIQLVGWYHSHHRFAAFPTLRDCDKQLNYQIKLRGTSDLDYTPCIGFIHAAYDDSEDINEPANVQAYWVLPPPENRPYELGKPLIVNTNIRELEEVTDDMRDQMKACAEYYETMKLNTIDFNTAKYKDDTPVIEKFKTSIFHKLPLDEEKAAELWNWTLEILNVPKEEPVIMPKIFNDKVEAVKRAKEEEEEAKRQEVLKQEAAKQEALRQEVLKQEMEAREAKLMEELMEREKEKEKEKAEAAAAAKASAAQSLPLPPSYKQSLSSTSTTFSSPRDSPASIPSSANSPAKFEVPIRSTPSPAKSESPSLKPRFSPASKIHADWQNEAKKNQNLASLFELPKSSSSNFIYPGEDSRRTPPVSIYPLPPSSSHSSNKKASTSTTTSNSKAATSAASSQSKNNANYWLSQIPNMEDFLKQLEKGDLSVLMQSPYNLPMYSQSPPQVKEKPAPKAKSSYDQKSTSSSGSNSSSGRQQQQDRSKKDALNALQMDAFKDSSEKLLNLMKSPEYTQMLLKSSKMSASDLAAIEKLSSYYATPAPPPPPPQKSTASSSRQQSQSQSAHEILSKQLSAQQQTPYYPQFDMKYLEEISKQTSKMKKGGFNPSNPDDFNALLQMELFSKSMAPNSMYGKSSSMGGGQSRNESAASRKADKQQIDMSAYGLPANLKSFMYDMPSTSPSQQKPSKSQSKSQSSAKQQSQHASYGSPSSHKDNKSSSDLKHPSAAGYNVAELMKINSLLGSSKDMSMLHPLYNDYYASLGLLNPQHAPQQQTKSSSSSERSSSNKAATNSKDYSSLGQMLPSSQLHAMSSLFPGTKPSDLEAILKNSYFSEQMMKAQQDMMEQYSKKSMKSSSSSSSPYKRSETITQQQQSKKDALPPIPKDLDITFQKSMENVANSIFKYGDLGLSRTYSGTSTESSRKSMSNSPVDFSKERSVPPKKRMEFSSIAELSSSSKKPKYDDDNDGGVLNLSNK